MMLVVWQRRKHLKIDVILTYEQLSDPQGFPIPMRQ